MQCPSPALVPAFFCLPPARCRTVHATWNGEAMPRGGHLVSRFRSAAAGPPPGLATAADSIRVYNWNDYIAPQVLESFSRETGIAVEYRTFSSAEELAAALASGEAIDITVPSHNDLPALMDLLLLPNRKHLDRQLLNKLAALDPRNRHAVPYPWGAVGLAINVPQAEAAYGGTLPDS